MNRLFGFVRARSSVEAFLKTHLPLLLPAPPPRIRIYRKKFARSSARYARLRFAAPAGALGSAKAEQFTERLLHRLKLSHLRIFYPKSGDGMSRKGAKALRTSRCQQAVILPPGECEPMRISLRLCAFARHPLLPSPDLGLPVWFIITSTGSRASHECKSFLHGNHHYHRRQIKICERERLLLPLLNFLKEFGGEFLSSGYLLCRHLLFENIPRFRRFGCTLRRR